VDRLQKRVCEPGAIVMDRDRAALPTLGDFCPNDSHQEDDVANFMSCVEQCPYRRPDWRWQLASRLNVDRRLRRRPEFRDPWVQRVRKALRVGTVGARSRSRRREETFVEVVHRACEIHFNRDPLVSAEVQAWILSGSAPAMIADRCGLPVDVVVAFEKLFFDVRHRLEAVGYVLHVVIGPPIRFGFSLDDLGSLWKFCSYTRGPHALDVLLQVFPGGKPRPWPSTFPATPAERRKLIAACKRMVLIRCLRPADMSPADIVRLLILIEWGLVDQEADWVQLSGIGAISKVDVTSHVEPPSEDLDSIAVASCSSPVSVLRGGCTGAGGGGNSDGNRQVEIGPTGLDLSGEPVEPVHRVTA
jgi:hypothetical protein